MKNLDKESKTRLCLMKSYAGESQARNRYNWYAKVADKEGFKQIAAIFNETADNEKEHAKRFYKLMGEEFAESIIIEASYPIGISDKTVENLEFAAKGEHEENTLLYPSFEKIAREEGYTDIASNYLSIIEVEKVHEQRYLDLMENIKSGKIFKRDMQVIWKCRNCGYHYIGNSAPDTCPACKHPRAYFELYAKNY